MLLNHHNKTGQSSLLLEEKPSSQRRQFARCFVGLRQWTVQHARSRLTATCHAENEAPHSAKTGVGPLWNRLVGAYRCLAIEPLHAATE